VAAFVADGAVQGMVQHEPFDDIAAELHGFRVRGGHNHAIFGLGHATHFHPLQRPLEKHDGADPAGADGPHGRVITEPGDHDPQFLGGFQYIGAFRDFNRPVIDGQLRHESYAPGGYRDGSGGYQSSREGLACLSGHCRCLMCSLTSSSK
jgi:hypothetical protein